MNRIIQLVLRSLIAPAVEPRLRAGSIKAVKGYLQAIKVARLALMGLFGIGAFAAVLVAGVCMLIFGGVGLLPIEPQTVALIILIVGAVMTLGSGLALFMILNQKRWLEVSRSYELMEAVMAPWPDSIPPNIGDVLRGNGPKVENFHQPVQPLATPAASPAIVPGAPPVVPYVPVMAEPAATRKVQNLDEDFSEKYKGTRPGFSPRRDELSSQVLH